MQLAELDAHGAGLGVIQRVLEDLGLEPGLSPIPNILFIKNNPLMVFFLSCLIYAFGKEDLPFRQYREKQDERQFQSSTLSMEENARQYKGRVDKAEGVTGVPSQESVSCALAKRNNSLNKSLFIACNVPGSVLGIEGHVEGDVGEVVHGGPFRKGEGAFIPCVPRR